MLSSTPGPEQPWGGLLVDSKAFPERRSRLTTQEVPDFVPLCRTADVRLGEGRQFRPTAGRWRNKPMAVWNDGGTFYVTNMICPHMGGPLSEGKLTDGVIECPWHGWTYYAATGMPDHEDGHSIAVYEAKVQGDQVMVGGIIRPSGT